MGRVPIVTLHDAIYSTASDLRTVEAAFLETFDAIGCRLTLKIDAAMAGNPRLENCPA